MKRGIINSFKGILSKKIHLPIFIIIIIILSFIAYAFLSHLKDINKEKYNDGFRWDLAKGEEIEVYFSQHPYVEAIINTLPEFQKRRG